jgi:hypothetical protein
LTTTWVERTFRNLIYFNEVDKGGHFAGWEQPELLAAEVRAAFRSLRQLSERAACELIFDRRMKNIK